MRVLAQIPHPECQITLFAWNGKYIVKLERGMLEQTYKISELDVASEAEVRQIIEDQAFVQGVLRRFAEMEAALGETMNRLEL